MARPDRRYDGGPHYPLDQVHACLTFAQMVMTRRAFLEAPRVLPSGTIDVKGVLRELVAGLTEEQWRFSQEKEGRWVDVYEVTYTGRERLWLKIKLEVMAHAKQNVVVISFHEWDNTRPI